MRRPNYVCAPAPAFKYRVSGGAKIVDLYDQCHRAWRAGIIDSWYYGRRSPDDPTIVWELNGIEGEPSTIGAQLAARVADAGVVSLAWGRTWCGYRELVVVLTNGVTVRDRYNGHCREEVAA